MKLRIAFIVICGGMIVTEVSSQNEDQIRLLFGGDIMCHETQLLSAYDSLTNTYSFTDAFEEIRPLVQQADLAIANFETTLPGSDYSGYPAFGSPDAFLKAIKETGFNLLVTANNHAYDKGRFGLERTIRKMNESGILHTGTFLNSEDKELLNPLVVTVKGAKIAVINYSYGINQSYNIPEHAINLLDTSLLVQDIANAQKKSADWIIVFMHWGNEYDTLHSEQQSSLTDWILKQGVNMVIGAHPHVVQPAYRYHCPDSGQDKLVAYSLGNLISNQRTGKRKEGALIEICLERNHSKLSIKSALFHPTYVKRTGIKIPYDYLITLPALPVPISRIADL